MEKELDEFLVSDDELKEVSGGRNIKVFGQWMDVKKGALAICQNMNQYPGEGKELVKSLYKMACSGNQNGTVDLLKKVCSAYPAETKKVFSIGVDRTDTM